MYNLWITYVEVLTKLCTLTKHQAAMHSLKCIALTSLLVMSQGNMEVKFY